MADLLPPRETRDAFITGLLLGVFLCFVLTLFIPDPVRVVVVTQKVKVTWHAHNPEPPKPKLETVP